MKDKANMLIEEVTSVTNLRKLVTCFFASYG